MKTYAYDDPEIPDLPYWSAHDDDPVPHGRDLPDAVTDWLEDVPAEDWPAVLTVTGYVAGEPLEDGMPGCMLDNVCEVMVPVAAFVRAEHPSWLDPGVVAALELLEAAQ